MKTPRLSMLANRVSPASQRLTPKSKTADPVYATPAWRALITAIIKQRGRRCEECGRMGTRIYGDHIRELKDGGALLDPNNVLLRCGSCHTRKTNEERARRMATRW